MSVSPRPVAPPRWLRTLLWLAGLLLGASAHIVWWSGAPARQAEVTTLEATTPSVHIHLHPGANGPKLVARAPRDRFAPASSSVPTPATGARGAVICQGHTCTIRRDFIERLQQDPNLLSHRPWPVRNDSDGRGHRRVEGVYPGSVAELLGLRNGDAIVAVNGQPLEETSPAAPDAPLVDADDVTITLRRADGLHTLRYTIIEG